MSNLITIHPNLERISKHFTFFNQLDEDLKIKLTKWEYITEKDREYVNSAFLSRKVKVPFDDVYYIFNYLKFLSRVNDLNEDAEKAAHDLWPLFNLINSTVKLSRISVKTEEGSIIKVTSKDALQSLHHVLKFALKEYKPWGSALNYLETMRDKGKLDNLINRPQGNEIDFTGTALKRLVTDFINYLKENSQLPKGRKPSLNRIIGELLVNTGFVNGDLSDRYKSDSEHLISKVIPLDLNRPKNKRIKDELFSPIYFIQLNKALI